MIEWFFHFTILIGLNLLSEFTGEACALIPTGLYSNSKQSVAVVLTPKQRVVHLSLTVRVDLRVFELDKVTYIPLYYF